MKVSENYYDEIFDFEGQWGQSSACGLRILEKEGKQIVIVTELYQDNPGTSVTAAGCNLLKQICEKKKLQLANIIYLECNPDTNSKLSFYDEKYFQVIFIEENGKLVYPQYRQLSEKEIKELF